MWSALGNQIAFEYAETTGNIWIATIYEIAETDKTHFIATEYRVDVFPRVKTTFVVHDFDISGYTICRTVQEDTTRFQFRRPPRVEDLELRCADVKELGLDSEDVD